MRSDLENNLAKEVDFHSLRMKFQDRTLAGNVTLLNQSTIVQIFDPNGANRTITLPAMQSGRVFLIAHSGLTNTLNVVDTNAVSICVVQGQEAAWLFCTGTQWISTPDVMVGSGPLSKGGLVPRPPLVSGTLKFLREDGQWIDPGFVGDNAYGRMTDGSNTATAVGMDIFWLRTANTKLSILVTNNDATFGDNALFTINEANINHDALLNYVADQHVAHSTVQIATPANSGLAGGGTIAATRSLFLDVSNLVARTPVLADSVPFLDISVPGHSSATFSAVNLILDHNVLVNYVANQHIDHTTVSIAAGAGLTGGGTIAATRTISLDIAGQDAQPPATNDEFIYWDVSGVDYDKCTFTTLNGVLDHNSLLNYVAAQHRTHPVSTDLAIAKYTGVVGDLANSGIFIDASNNMTGAGTIDVGNADTTLSRTAAGTLAVEGKQVLLNSQTATISKGFTLTPNNLGTMANFTVDPTLGNYQFGTNNAAFTLTAPASDCAVDILVTNGAAAGAITFSGFTAPAGGGGDVYAVTNTFRFMLMIRRINAISTYLWKALQ